MLKAKNNQSLAHDTNRKTRSCKLTRPPAYIKQPPRLDMTRGQKEPKVIPPSYFYFLQLLK